MLVSVSQVEVDGAVVVGAYRNSLLISRFPPGISVVVPVVGAVPQMANIDKEIGEACVKTVPPLLSVSCTAIDNGTYGVLGEPLIVRRSIALVEPIVAVALPGVTVLVGELGSVTAAKLNPAVATMITPPARV